MGGTLDAEGGVIKPRRRPGRPAVVVAQIAAVVVIATIVGRCTATTPIDHDIPAARRTASQFVKALLVGNVDVARFAAAENIRTEALTSIARRMAERHMTLGGAPHYVPSGPVVPIIGERIGAGYRFDLVATDPKTGWVTRWMFLAAVESSGGEYKINGIAFRATSPVLVYGTPSAKGLGFLENAEWGSGRYTAERIL